MKGLKAVPKIWNIMVSVNNNCNHSLIWIISCWSIDLVPGILFDLMGNPGIDPPMEDRAREELQSDPALAIEPEAVASILFSFEFCRLQSLAECWFTETFLLHIPGRINIFKAFSFCYWKIWNTFHLIIAGISAVPHIRIIILGQNWKYCTY